MNTLSFERVAIGALVAAVVVMALESGAPQYTNVYIAVVVLGFIIANNQAFSAGLAAIGSKLQ